MSHHSITLDCLAREVLTWLPSDAVTMAYRADDGIHVAFETRSTRSKLLFTKTDCLLSLEALKSKKHDELTRLLHDAWGCKSLPLEDPRGRGVVIVQWAKP
jgi:hypothetical protein